MHHHFSTYYELDKKIREQELAYQLEKQYWVEQTRSRRPRRFRRVRAYFAMFIGLLVRA